jgi:hypothetical protein
VDAVEIIILAAAGVGLVAFLVLAVLILRQGRSLKELEERIGPPVPPAAAPSLERVRAVAAQSAPAAVVATEAVDQPGPAPTAGEAQPAQVPSEQGDAQPRQTARQAADARAAEQAAKKARAQQDRPATSPAADDDDAGSGRGLVMGATIVVIVALLAAGSWYLFIRDDGPGSPAASGQQATTATVADTGEIPEDVPPLANKAAYTVAVLNASNVTGAAANKVAPRVQADGYTLGVVDNAAKQGLAESQVQYVKGRREVGWNLAKDLGVTRAVQVDSLSQGRIGTADAVIIVGKDLAK